MMLYLSHVFYVLIIAYTLSFMYVHMKKKVSHKP